MRKYFIILLFLVNLSTLLYSSEERGIKDSEKVKINKLEIENYMNNHQSNNLSKDDLINLLVKKSSSENWLTVLITSLGVLFAIMAIVVTIVIFKQNHDYKTKFNEAIENFKKASEEYKNIIDQFMESKRKDLEDLLDSYNSTLLHYKEEKSETLSENNEKVNERIKDIEKHKNIIEKQLKGSIVNAVELNSSNPFSSLGMPTQTQTHHNCSKCGFGYVVRRRKTGNSLLDSMLNASSSGSAVTCPECGNADKI